MATAESVKHFDQLRKWPAHVIGFLLALLVCYPAKASHDIRFNWQADFSVQEREQLRSWVADTQRALESLVGHLPRPLKIQIQRSPRSREPVPWAQTIRSKPQGVLFVVDTRHSDEAFRKDWTASHELSHLAFPYVGRSAAWFSEGFATYMQYAVMQEMGTLSAQQVQKKRQSRILAAQRNYPYGRAPFGKSARRLHANGHYSVLYWGGASYFMRVDAELRSRGSSLIKIVRQYVKCCRRDHDQLNQLINTLDKISGGQPTFELNRQRLFEDAGLPLLDPKS